MKKLKTLAINLVTVFVTFAVVVAIAEAGVRIAKIEGLKKIPENNKRPFFMMSDPVLGWSAKPNTSGVYKGYENTATIQINSGGFRGTEVAKNKPKNTLRIAVLGDSFTMAVQVELEQTFVKVVEAELGKCQALGDRKIEVLNFGVRGYSTAQELLTLQHKVWDYQPDMVILAFFIGNDVTDNSKQLEKKANRPFFILNKNGDLVLDSSWRSSETPTPLLDKLPAELVNNVKLLQIIKKVEVKLRRRIQSINYHKLSANNFKEPPNEAWKEAWEITEKLLVKMSEEVEEKEVEFLVVIIGTANQVEQNKELREQYFQSYKIEDLFYPGNRVKGVGDRENFPVLNLERDMQAYVDKTGECLHGFSNKFCGGHWNEKGHRLAGELISKKLCSDFNKPK